MGQIFVPSRSDIILTATDRLVARNADGGLSPAAQNVILFGEAAGTNLSNSEVIAIGAFSADAGINDLNLVGSVFLGVRAGSALTDAGNASIIPASVVIIGRDAMPVAAHASSSVIIGDGALLLANPVIGLPMRQNVVIGADITNANFTGAGGRSYSQNVVIGYGSAQPRAAANETGLSRCVIIGDQAATNYGIFNVTNLTNCVVIGAGAATNISSNGSANGDHVIIGRDAAQAMEGFGNTVIGASAGASMGVGTDRSVIIGQSASGAGDNCVLIGQALAHSGGGANTVMIGSDDGSVNPAGNSMSGNYCIAIGGSSHVLTGDGNIVIGTQAGNGETPGNTDRFIVETVINTVRKTIVYGNLATGNMILGTSVPGTDRDVDGAASRNILKLLNGVVGALAPVGGGYFYVSAGLLHWVTSTGVDRILTPAAQLASQTGAAYTNNAAAAGGTLLNAPVAGNPTKWIPINDNGTIRNIPAW